MLLSKQKSMCGGYLESMILYQPDAQTNTQWSLNCSGKTKTHFTQVALKGMHLLLRQAIFCNRGRVMQSALLWKDIFYVTKSNPQSSTKIN